MPRAWRQPWTTLPSTSRPGARRSPHLPWQARHPYARAATQAEAYEVYERYRNDPDSAAVNFGEHPRVRDYARRVDEWRVASMSQDELHSSLFGEESLAQAKEAEREDKAQRRVAAQRVVDQIDNE